MKQYLNIDGKIVGHLHDDGIFRKRVVGSKHLYKNEDAWGIDEVILNKLPEGTEIRILDTETNIIYITTVERFKSGSKIDFGHGMQIVFWRGFFDTVKDGIKTPSTKVSDWTADYSMFQDYKKI